MSLVVHNYTGRWHLRTGNSHAVEVISNQCTIDQSMRLSYKGTVNFSIKTQNVKKYWILEQLKNNVFKTYQLISGTFDE